MNEFSWPYVSHDKELFLSKIILAESYLQKFGAKYIGKMNFAGYVPIRTACYANLAGIVQLFSYHDSAIASCGICFHILVFLKSIPSGKLLQYNGSIDKFDFMEETLMNEFSWPYVIPLLGAQTELVGIILYLMKT